MVRATASMSAPAKFSVTGSPGRTLDGAAPVAVWAFNGPPAAASIAPAAMAWRANRRRCEFKEVIGINPR